MRPMAGTGCGTGQWPGASGAAQSARQRRRATLLVRPVAQKTGWSPAARSARWCPHQAWPPGAGLAARGPAGAAARPRPAGSRRRFPPGCGAARAWWQGRCLGHGPGPGRCGQGTALPACQRLRPPPAGHGWAASHRRSPRGCARCRLRCSPPAPPWPSWQCRACCGVRPASSAQTPAFRRAGRCAGRFAAPGPRCRLRARRPDQAWTGQGDGWEWVRSCRYCPPPDRSLQALVGSCARQRGCSALQKHGSAFF